MLAAKPVLLNGTFKPGGLPDFAMATARLFAKRLPAFHVAVRQSLRRTYAAPLLSSCRCLRPTALVITLCDRQCRLGVA
jgi:hypothetical protein